MWIIVSEYLMINTSTAKEIRRDPGSVFIGDYKVFDGTDADAVFLEILTAIAEGKCVFNLLNRTKGGEKP